MVGCNRTASVSTSLTTHVNLKEENYHVLKQNIEHTFSALNYKNIKAKGDNKKIWKRHICQLLFYRRLYSEFQIKFYAILYRLYI